MALIEHEVPEHGLVHLLELRKENLEIVEVQIAAGSPTAPASAIERLELPDGARLISVMRERPVRDRRRRRRRCAPAIRCSRSCSLGKEDELRRVLLERR